MNKKQLQMQGQGQATDADEITAKAVGVAWTYSTVYY